VTLPPPDAWWTRSGPDVAAPSDVAVEDEVTVEEPPRVVVRPGPTVLLSRRRLRQIRQLRQSRDHRARRRRRRLLPAAIAAGIVLAGGAGAVLLTMRPDPVPPAARTAGRAVPVDRASVTATASSTQSPDGTITYAAANTLDGDLSTAWNSDGAKGRGPGTTLTYTFAQPVDLRDITVHNGYQKVRTRPGKAPLDLYPVNQRVRRLRVVTDAGSWAWELADTRAAQTFAGAAGRTGSVRLEIVTVYRSTTYPDVALSEVAFTAGLEP
jgi:hypothetical protein